MQANSWHYELFHFHWSFKPDKSCKEGEKLQKPLVPQERKGLF